MGKVSTKSTDQGEGQSFEKLPENVRARITGAVFERIHRPETETKDGKIIKEQTYTAAILTCVVPEAVDPEKEYRVELKAGKALLPSEDGMWLDDRECTTEASKKLNKNTSYAVFLNSLLAAGAEDGTYTEQTEEEVSDSISKLVGMEFQSGVTERDGGGDIGKYNAMIATRVFGWTGEEEAAAEEEAEPADPDMEVVVGKIQATLAANKAGLMASELLKKVTGLSKAQQKKFTEAMSSAEWINGAIEQGLFKRDAKTKKLVKA